MSEVSNFEDPIFFRAYPWRHEAGEGWETLPAGWYFWNEIWVDPHGPFDSKKEAAETLAAYVKTI